MQLVLTQEQTIRANTALLHILHEKTEGVRSPLPPFPHALLCHSVSRSRAQSGVTFLFNESSQAAYMPRQVLL